MKGCEARHCAVRLTPLMHSACRRRRWMQRRNTAPCARASRAISAQAPSWRARIECDPHVTSALSSTRAAHLLLRASLRPTCVDPRQWAALLAGGRRLAHADTWRAAMGVPLGAPWRQPVGAPWRLLARLFALAAVLQPCATTRRECGLVIVEAGAPRTGSTQQERLINVALKELGLSDKVSDCGYYDWANHAGLDAAEAKAAAADLEARPCPSGATRGGRRQRARVGWAAECALRCSA